MVSLSSAVDCRLVRCYGALSLLLNFLLTRAEMRPTVLNPKRTVYFQEDKMPDYPCYSCMNYAMKNYWPQLQSVYYAPQNFTDACLHPTRNSVGQVNCRHSVCIAILEPKYLAGHFMGQNVIRGCANSLFRKGHDNRVIRARHYGPGTTWCKVAPAQQVLPSSLRNVASNRTVRMCNCYGFLCNDQDASSDTALRHMPLSTLLALSISVHVLHAIHSIIYSIVDELWM